MVDEGQKGLTPSHFLLSCHDNCRGPAGSLEKAGTSPGWLL